MRHLLVFAKAPLPGAVKTRLAAAVGNDAACGLYRALVRDTAEVVSALEGLAVEAWVDGDAGALGDLLPSAWPLRAQPQGDLGERLSAAFDAAFRAGGGPVAVIGTDAPLLAADDLRALFEALEGGFDAALLPADDGGYVALGLARPCPEAFAGIPWSTARTCDATVAALRAAGLRVRLLTPLYDVDDGASLARLAADLERTPAVARHSARALAELRASAVLDALGRAVPLDPEPRRVVSLVPSVTECLFDAGLGERVAGRTDFCFSPPEAARVPSVGGPKSVDAQALFRLAPDLVLANAEENDRGQVEALVAAGLRVHVAFPRTLAQTSALLKDLGALLRAPAPFDGFARALARAAAAPAGRRPVRCACLVWKAPYMTASGDTLTSALLAAAGAENVFAKAREFRYPAVSLAELAAAAPRVVLLPTEPYAFTEDDAREVEAAVPGAAALRVPGEWLTWYGSRMDAALVGLRRALDPFRDPT